MLDLARRKDRRIRNSGSYKTSDVKWKEAEQIILKNHPYEVPCVIKIEATANDSYESWVNESTL